MISLAIDTALQRCSVALFAQERVIGVSQISLEKGHAERLAPMVQSVLNEAGLGVRDLDRIGVIVGPGGFTGVRVGLAFARGLALGMDLKVVAISSLEALAMTCVLNQGALNLNTDALIAPLIDARRGEVYAGLYRWDGQCLSQLRAPFAASPDEVRDWLGGLDQHEPIQLTGTGAGLVWPSGATHLVAASPQTVQIDIASMGLLLRRDLPDPYAPPAPLYLRSSGAKPSAASLFAHLAAQQNEGA